MSDHVMSNEDVEASLARTAAACEGEMFPQASPDLTIASTLNDVASALGSHDAGVLARGFELGVKAAIWWLKDHAEHRPEPTRQRLREAADDIAELVAGAPEVELDWNKPVQ